jgi:cell volume regulation protein A
MFFGEDGPGGIYFDNYFAAFAIGSMALAIILFDGGLRTDFANFRIAAWPALVLATVGVAITAALTGVAAHWLLGLGRIESFLIGAVVASTDAAAVFFLLHLHGLDIKPRVRSVLEVESGLNDPIAVFLTVGCVALLLDDGAEPAWRLAVRWSG